MIKLFYLPVILFFAFSGPMRDQYSKAADRNVAEVLGTGELKATEIVSGREFYIFESSGENNGSIVVFSSAKGRYDNFDYMIILDAETQILDIKILKYRSEYGYEISSKSWLRQFYKKPGSRFEYRKNIDALAGATYSAPSLVEDVNQVLDHLGKVK